MGIDLLHNNITYRIILHNKEKPNLSEHHIIVYLSVITTIINYLSFTGVPNFC